MSNQKRVSAVPTFLPGSSCYLESIGKTPLTPVDDRGENDGGWAVNPGSSEGRCGRFALLGDDETGHKFAKSLDCGREWCPECKEVAHGRRFARWLSKAQKIGVMGYLIVTFPEDKRPRDKKRLSWIGIQITRGLKKRGIHRGLRRWHFFGEKSHKWNPHLNFLLESGYLSPKKLTEIKRMIRDVLKIPEAVIYYQFSRSRNKKIHWLKYVTRPTFLDREWDEVMADEIYNFRNSATFGKWLDEDKWDLPKSERILGYVSKIEASICPICGKDIHWRKIVYSEELELMGYEQVWAKVWQAVPPDDLEGRGCVAKKVVQFNFLKSLQRDLKKADGLYKDYNFSQVLCEVRNGC